MVQPLHLLEGHHLVLHAGQPSNNGG
jgi:hypothetical protein